MNERIKETLTAVREKWTGIPLGRRVIICILFAAIIVVSVVTVSILTRPDYVKLYDSMEQSSAAEVVTAIQGMGFTAEMRSDGSVYVLSGTENSIVMLLAQEGFPQDSIPYDTYVNNTDMFTTESQKQEYLRQSIEERIQRIVGTLDGIDHAIVQLTIPDRQNTVISTLRQEPYASVTVFFKPGKDALTNKQIQGITSIVKAADAGLTEENISITDGAGIRQISTEDSGASDIDKLNAQYAYRTRLEKDTQSKIDDLLTPIYGADGFMARVTIDLDFDSRAEEIINYSGEDENNTGVVSRDDSADASGSSTVTGDVAGEEPNTEEYPEGLEAGTDGAWTDNSRSTDYLVDVSRSQVVKDGYDINGMQVSVAIYRDRLPETEVESIRTMVGTVTGINPDVVNDVVSVAYFRPLQLQEIEEDTEPTLIFGLTANDLIVIGAILVIILIVITMIFVLVSASHKKRRKAFERKIIDSGHFDLGDTSSNEIEKTLYMLNKDKPESEIPSLLDDGVETKEVIIRKEIANFARHSPEIVAALLRNWMTMDEDEVHRVDRDRAERRDKDR